MCNWPNSGAYLHWMFTYIFDLVITHRIQQNKIKYEQQSCQDYKLKLETKFPGNSLISSNEISVISIGHMSGDYGLYN